MPPEKLLFVCTGNICRSALAERLARKIAADRGLALEVKSCGVAAEGYFQVPDEIEAELRRRGATAAGHKPQLVGRALLAWCDAALVMTRGHERLLHELFPEHARKVFLLRAYAGLGQEDVADPMGRSAAAYAACAQSIASALEALLAKTA